jgi:hypothetical protein
MRPLRLVPVLALLFAACSAAVPRTPVNQVPEMRIVDPGEIYSTYDLRNDDQARNEVRAQGVTDAGWQEILRLANESQWPAGIQDVTGRSTRRDEIRRYRAFRIANFRDKVILLVPSDQGSAVPADMQGRKFYIVIGQGGVTPVS